ncbi:hypothetical protein ACS0TY_031693 [Phlomoides rotata]
MLSFPIPTSLDHFQISIQSSRVSFSNLECFTMGGKKAESDCEIQTGVASSSTPPQWIDLLGDVTANILRRLDVIEILESAQKVCTTWQRVCLDPTMWRVIHILRKLYPCFQITCLHNRRDMCLCAVGRSQGQLLDLSIENFGDDELLNYIVDRSSDLKRLTLHACSWLTRKCLVEAVKKLPLLEELQLTILPSVKAADVEAIGISCPMLKSFTFNRNGFSNPSVIYNLDEPNRNKYALAIAENMPNLCHLRFIGNTIDNEGLESILDGCPNLESLDLRQCFGLDLQQGLGKRCSKQIKHLKSPLDAVSEIQYLGAMYELDYIYDIPYIDVFEDEDIDFELDIDEYPYIDVFDGYYDLGVMLLSSLTMAIFDLGTD